MFSRRTAFRVLFVIVSIVCPSAHTTADSPSPQHRLAVRGSQFTVNDKVVFLLGCSYYAALGAEEDVWKKDLDDMQSAGINWIRVWATWSAFDNDVSAVDESGRAREPYLEKLKKLVAECDRRGMVVDVTLSRGNGVTGPSRLGNLETHQRAVETLVEALKPWQNWYLDLSNERNIGDKRFTSYDDLKHLRARAREVAPDLLVTASQGGDISDDELKKYITTVGVDFVCPHRPRDRRSPEQTQDVTRKMLQTMKDSGRVVPIHYQEPFRRAYGLPPEVKDFQTDLRGAVSGGAAGWCFHNGSNRDTKDGHPRRSFDLSAKRLFDQLDDVERETVRSLKDIVRVAGDERPQ